MNMNRVKTDAIIYEICHTPSTNRYIGSSIQGFRRVTQHIWQLQKGRHGNSKLQELWNNSESSEWTFRILESIPEDKRQSREAHWIQLLSPTLNVKQVTSVPSKHEAIERILDLRQRGATIRQIAQLTRVPISTIHGYLQRYTL